MLYVAQYSNKNILSIALGEEAVRLLSPIQCILRTTTEDSEMLRVPVHADHKIINSTSAGDHDARKFENPNEYRVINPG